MREFRRKSVAILCLLSFLMMLFLNQEPSSNVYSTAAHYISSAFNQTGSTNVVTSIYLHYRYYDTLFEALMLLFSILAVVYLSIHEGDELDE